MTVMYIEEAALREAIAWAEATVFLSRHSPTATATALETGDDALDRGALVERLAMLRLRLARLLEARDT